MATKQGVVAAVVTVVLGLGSLLTSATSHAHPLGNFSISRYTSIQVEHNNIGECSNIDRHGILSPKSENAQEAI